ncbi:MAG: hypothetical protein L0287_31425, partial [Anaerolineae bacterium]|nr:hypothetical protein [Anaerolineae bacterium]
GLYSTSMGITLTYPPVDNPKNMPYWFFSYWDGIYRRSNELVPGTVLESGIRNHTFSGDSRQSLLINYAPELGQCLQVFSLRDEGVREIPAYLEELLSISDLDRITNASPVVNWNLPKSIFGEEPEHNWCYYFETAELAGQNEDWVEVIRLFEIAQQQGYNPSDVHEYLSLLDAYLKQNQVGDAYDLSLQIERVSRAGDDASRVREDQICTVWLRNTESTGSKEMQEAFEQIREQISCFD